MQTSPKQPMTDNDLVRSFLTAKADALVRRSRDALAGLIHTDFVYVNAAGNSFDKASYIETYCASGKVVFLSQRLRDLKVARFSDTIVATMTLRDHFRSGDTEIKAAFHSISVLVEADNRWLWAAGQTMSAGEKA